jgi:putative holliday junction resolvase
MPESFVPEPSMPESRVADRPLARQYLAFDPGRRRIGVATGNTVTGAASPLVTLSTDRQAHWPAIGRLIADWRPDALVVGMPCHPDGAPHAATRLAQRFAADLQRRHGLPVHAVDERYSSVEAERDRTANLAGGLDAAAAAVILDQFLRAPTAPMPPSPSMALTA